jgi:signal transduction histidine kinase
MRTRLSLLLLALMGVVLVSLGVPLAGSIAGGETRRLHADRVADLTMFAGQVPPAADPDRPNAVRANQVEAASVQQDLTRYDDTFGIYVTVVDAAGRGWLSSRATKPAGAGERPVREAMRAALHGRLTDETVRLLPWDTQPLVVAMPVVRDGDVVGAVVSVSPTQVARERVLRRWLLLAGAELIALAGAAVLAIRLASWLLRPVARLDEAAHQISGGDLSARVPTGRGPPELRRLEMSFNDMAVHVEDAVEAQRAFVADASHQLRNPMAALLLRLEGLKMAPAERLSAAAEVALSDGRNLADTLDRMLELARIEHAGASAATLDVGALVDERLGAWRVIAQHRSINVQRTGALHATGRHEPRALAGAVDAVVDNALKYSPEHSTVTIAVEAADLAGPGEPVAIVVTDDGPGVPAEELPHLAERFWRSGRTAGESGSGLGMSIAKALLERHGGALEMESTRDRGLRVRLLVPETTMGDAEASAAQAGMGRGRGGGQGLVRR